MRYFAVIGTNVLVSAMLKWESVPGSIVNLAIDGPIVPVLNENILKEYREVLSLPKFHLSNDIVSDIIESIKKVAIFVDEEYIDIELPDPKDRVFYEVVMEERRRIPCNREHQALPGETLYRNSERNAGYYPERLRFINEIKLIFLKASAGWQVLFSWMLQTEKI